ncbi:MAG: diaminopimelate epimerase [Actinomycetia bacterium]|nr:diaminopimelate epimerase [Actinomycetes bacterium]
MRSFSFAKGQATLNDFVLITDRHNTMPLSEADVAWICDRRAGIGADGVLRAVKGEFIREWRGDPDWWFMDYRNADGSVADACGNGLRLFVRYLIQEDLAPRNEVFVGTRAGARTVWELFDGRLRATMGPVSIDEEPTWVALGGHRYEAHGADVGNPHAVVLLDAPVDALDLRAPVTFDRERFPAGVNVEFAARAGEHRLRLRVVERGVGETRSCGTGVVAAAAVAAQAWTGEPVGDLGVDVPGGRLDVRLRDGQSYLTGPAVVVARGEATLPD